MASHDSVVSFYQAIEKELCRHLHFNDSNLLEIVRPMTGGFSGAEVYQIRLNCPEFKGNYFLKIEKAEGTPQAEPTDIPFPHAKCVKFFRYNKYSAYIFEPAGLSTIDFHPYREMQATPEILQDIIGKHLRACQKQESVQHGLIFPNEIMRRMLGKKLERKRDLYRYLSDNVRGDPAIFTSISFCDIILPNPFAFSFSAKLWNEHKISDAACPCHGDMHGENLLMDPSGKYCLIDHMLYISDGWLFYDSAYFEIAELLQACGTDLPKRWLCNMRKTAKGQFDDLEFNGLAMVQAIRDAELAWVDEICNPRFSYKDDFLQARLLARVIAGLNFAGKRRMDADLRLKAFLYSAAYLEAMLNFWSISDWNSSSTSWEPGQEELSSKLAGALAEEAGNFERGPAFILFCGSKTQYSEGLGECLARIPWHSVFSFNPVPDGNCLFSALRDAAAITSFYPDCEPRGASAPFWIFAAGQVGHPETVANSFTEWNRRCHRFVENMLDKCISATSWSEPLVIVDADSLPSRYLEEIIRLCHGRGFPFLGILGKTRKLPDDLATQWQPMKVVHYPMDIMDLGAWCRVNLEPLTTSPVIVPCASERSGAVVPPKDIAAIEAHGHLIHHGLLSANTGEDIYSFYYGHPISWEALQQGLYVARDRKVDALIHKLEKCEDDVCVVNFPHLPGAGASMLCKSACWKLCNKYPVLELERLDGNLEDALLRLYTLCGLQLILLADNDFSPADITSLAARLHMRHISAVILYPRRVYRRRGDASSDNSDAGSDILGTLERSESEAFLNAYSYRLRQKDYSQDDMQKREKNLDRLAHTQDLAELRLPFFFGMFAYEKDFISLGSFIDRILERLRENDDAQKLVLYLALITQYLESGGLNIHVGAKFAGIENSRRLSASKILKCLHEICGAPIISCVRNKDSTVLRLVHPLFSEELLEKSCEEGAVAKSTFYKRFLHDLASLDEGIPSKEFEELAQALFLERDWGGKRLKFSPLIEDLDDYAAQKEIFEVLIEIFDTNAHFHQHFGRLISSQDPRDTSSALIHFTKAVELEPANMVHWHARGNFYLRCVAAEIMENRGLADIYNRGAELVALAMSDFNTALEKVGGGGGADTDVEYPINSIIKLSTLVLNTIKQAESIKDFKSWLMKPITTEMKWVTELLEKAEEVTLEAESFDRIHSEYGDIVRDEFARLRFSTEELESMIQDSHRNFVLKLAWMNSVESESATSERLQKMVDWGEDFIKQGNAHPGLIWRWFKAAILLGRDSSSLLKAVLHKAKNEKTLLICTYLQACLDFAAFMQGALPDSKECLKEMGTVRKIWEGNKYLPKPMLYYNPNMTVGLAITPEDAPEIVCKVSEEVIKPQTGWLYLEQDSRFRLFFVPVHFGCDIGQSLGKSVSCRIAISYDGLRAIRPDQKSRVFTD